MPVEITSVQRRGVAGKSSGFQWDNILLLFKKASSTGACLNPARPEHRLKAKHMLKSLPETDTGGNADQLEYGIRSLVHPLFSS